MKARTKLLCKFLLPLLIGAYIIYFLSGLSALEFYPLLSLLGIYAILAMSLNVVNGLIGQLHLGITGFAAIGAYSAGLYSIYCTQPEWGAWNMLFGVALAMLAAALAALLIGLPSLRLRGDYFAIVTLGFGEIMRNILELTYFPGGSMYPDEIDGIGGPTGISFTEFPEDVEKWSDIPNIDVFSAQYAKWWVILLCVLALYILLRNLKHSRFGRAFLTIREDEIAARSMGIHISFYKTIAFVLSSAIAGFAGALYFHHDTLKAAPQDFGLLKSVGILLMVVLGGLGSFSGAIIGAILLGVLPVVLRHIDLNSLTWLPESIRTFQVSQIEALLYSILLIVLIRLAPNGLMGTHEMPKSWIEAARKLFGKKGDTSDDDPEVSNPLRRDHGHR